MLAYCIVHKMFTHAWAIGYNDLNLFDKKEPPRLDIHVDVVRF
jgi:hypothetical protein